MPLLSERKTRRTRNLVRLSHFGTSIHIMLHNGLKCLEHFMADYGKLLVNVTTDTGQFPIQNARVTI